MNSLRTILGSTTKVIGEILSQILIMLFGLFVFSIANPLLLTPYMSKERPQAPSGELEEVPGLYGPGAYWAWVLCTISAIISSATEGHSSSALSPDQIASFIYSICSMYWYHGRVAWYGLHGPVILKDHSIQAASFVLNACSVLHILGAIFSIKKKRTPWIVLIIWELYLLFLSPMMEISRTTIAVHGYFFPVLCLVCAVIAFVFHPWYWATTLVSLIPFIWMEALRTQWFSTYSFQISPKTTYEITDLDQMVSLLSATAVVVYQWKLWRPSAVIRRLRTAFRRNTTRNSSNRLELGENGDHIVLGR
jgi:hypothetical protein